MDKLAKRYLITAAIGIASMLTALGVVLYQARDEMSRADSVVKPSTNIGAEQADAGHAPEAGSPSEPEPRRTPHNQMIQRPR